MKTASICFIITFMYFTSPCLAQESKTEIIEIFNKYIELNEKFIASVPKTSLTHNSNKKLRVSVETYVENVFNPALDFAIPIVCEKGDVEVLSKLIQVILQTRNSVDETPHHALGEMFICQPILFTDMFKNLSKKEMKIIYGSVAFGFHGISWGNQKDTPEYIELRKQLDALRNYIN